MNVQTSCPQSGYWKELLHGNVPEGLRTELTAHLDVCESCQRVVEELAADTPVGPEALRRLADRKPSFDPALQMAMAELKEQAGRTQTRVDGASDSEISLDFLDPPAKPGQLGKLGHYEVTEVIGRGGMGVVLKAFDTVLHRVVAIKVLAPQLATSATARRRFTREAQAAAAVSHEHVVAIHAVDEAKGLPYLVMEYVAGQSLQDRIDHSGPLKVTEILRIGSQAARGLAAAHTQGLIHRDIKPANILLENGVERVKITDFGLARAVDDASLTQSGVVAGTPQYMSPEQARGEPVDQRADLFSLGSVMYAMCTGRPPFRASTTMGVIRRVSEETPRPIREINSEIPDWLVAIIEKLHAKNPAERFQSATEVGGLLGQHLAHLQQPALVPMPRRVSRPAVRRPEKRSRAVVWVVAGVAVLLLAFCVLPILGFLAFFTLWSESEAKPQSAQAVRDVQFSQPVVSDRETPMAPLTDPVGGQRPRKILTGSNRPVAAVAFSPDKKTLATGDEAGNITLWDAASGTMRGDFKAHDRMIWSLTFSRDGKRLASGSWDHTVKVWDPDQPDKSRADLRGHTDRVWSVAFSPDGSLLASVSEDKTLRVWDATTGQHRRTFKLEGVGFSAAFSPNGELLVAGDSTGRVYFWDTATWQPPAVVQGHAVTLRLAFSPDGKTLATVSHDKLMILWDVEKRQKRATLAGFREMVESVAFSPDGKLLATGGGNWKNWSAPGEVTIWDIETRHFVRFQGHKSCVHTVAFSPDGKTLATASHDQTVKLWDESNWKLLQEAAEADQGWVPLFNGKDLTGWKTHPEQPGGWSVHDGLLVGSGRKTHLFSQRGDYENFHLRFEAKLKAGGDGGVFFRAPFSLKPKWGGPLGYEAQIAARTGTVLVGEEVFGNPAGTAPDTWFVGEVMATENRIVVRVNGQTTANFADSKDRYRKGHLALQVWSPETVVQFRKIEIKELPTR